jgi:glycosyltransferase involved in cell wall biosynthesis
MFRPTFYYRQRRMLASGVGSRALFALKWTVAYLCAKRPGIERVFLLDPFAEEYAVSCWRCRKFTLVPDPIAARGLLQVERGVDRPLTLLIAGALSPRKGIHLTVNALARSSEKTKRNLKLLLVGKPEEGYTDYVLQNVTRLRDMGIGVSSDFRFLSDMELDQHLVQSDVVLTPYMGFKGSSNVIIKAAHFGKPVLSANEGLLGYLVQQHKLGEALDVGNADTFSQCLDRIASTGQVSGFDPANARTFADSCDPEEFAKSLTAPLT